MTDSKFNLAAALGTLDRPELDRLLLERAATGDLPAVEALLRAGAAINVKNEGLRTALHLAARHGHTPTAALLIANGATVDLKDHYSWTPLLGRLRLCCLRHRHATRKSTW